MRLLASWLLLAALGGACIQVHSGSSPAPQFAEGRLSSEDPLIAAVWGQGVEAVRGALVSAPDSVSVCDDAGNSALGVAGLGARAAVVEALLGAGADPNWSCEGELLPLSAVLNPVAEVALAEDQPQGEGVVFVPGTLPEIGVDYGAPADRDRRIAVIELLIGKGADPNAGTDGPAPPLVVALMTGDRRFVELLVSHGADPSRLSLMHRMGVRFAGRSDLLEVARAAARQ